MDEATSALDYENERRIENLREQLHDCTVLYITHRLTAVKRADQIVMMRKDRSGTGSHDELMAARGVITRSTASRNLSENSDELFINQPLGRDTNPTQTNYSSHTVLSRG